MPDLPPRLATWHLPSVYPADHGLPVLAEVDVVVVGAGAAGVAAATVVAEAGHSVILVERYGFAGGAAVAGMSGTICGLYLASDDTTKGPNKWCTGSPNAFAAGSRSAAV
jgi:NADPH-dependent 2,4-dienoyl-CoA reductase/sulfur reductase-like enzyme